MCQNYFKVLLNIICKPEKLYMDKFKTIEMESSMLTPVGLKESIKDLTSGKSCGGDRMSSEHYKYASDKFF